MSYPPPPGSQPYQSAPPPGPGSGYGAPPTRLRGRRPLQLALIFFVIGLALAIIGGVVFATKSLSKVNDFSRVSVSGGTATLKTGNQLVYYEAPNVTSGIKRVPVPLIQLTAPDGTKRVLDTLYGGASRSSGQIKTRLTYDYNGHKGVAIYEVKISQAGTYNVATQLTGGEAANARLAFGKSIAGGTAAGVLLILAGVLLIIAAIVLFIVGLVKRRRHKKQLAGGEYGGGFPQQQGYPQQQNPPQQQGFPQQQGYPQQQGGAQGQQGYPPPGSQQ